MVEVVIALACSITVPHDEHTDCEGRTAPAPPAVEPVRRHVHSTSLLDRMVLIGAQACAADVLKALAEAVRLGFGLRVFDASFRDLQRIQALADAYRLPCHWRLELVRPVADLVIITGGGVL